VPPRATAILRASAETAPTQRDHDLRMTANGAAWLDRKPAATISEPKVETSIGRYKRAISDALRSHTDPTEVAIAAATLNRMLALGCPNYVRSA
jgi:hypothetical protein